MAFLEETEMEYLSVLSGEKRESILRYQKEGGYCTFVGLFTCMKKKNCFMIFRKDFTCNLFDKQGNVRRASLTRIQHRKQIDYIKNIYMSYRKNGKEVLLSQITSGVGVDTVIAFKTIQMTLGTIFAMLKNCLSDATCHQEFEDSKAQMIDTFMKMQLAVASYWFSTWGELDIHGMSCETALHAILQMMMNSENRTWLRVVFGGPKYSNHHTHVNLGVLHKLAGTCFQPNTDLDGMVRDQKGRARKIAQIQEMAEDFVVNFYSGKAAMRLVRKV